jgi:transposase-like protein
MRRAMVRPGRDKLHGNVEVDETFIGGEDQGGKRGRGAGRKSIVAIAIEVHNPKGFGRVRMQRIPDASAQSLVPFVERSVTQGSSVLTDSWRGYNGIEQQGYIHKRVKLSDSGDPAHIAMPGVHRISSLLKRWIIGTHQGSVGQKYLDYYLDEYTFRFNRRTSKARGLLFYRLLQQAVEVPPTTYKEMTTGNK